MLIARCSAPRRARWRSRSRRAPAATCARPPPSCRPRRPRRSARASDGAAQAQSPKAPSTCTQAPFARASGISSAKGSNAPLQTFPACRQTTTGPSSPVEHRRERVRPHPPLGVRRRDMHPLRPRTRAAAASDRPRNAPRRRAPRCTSGAPNRPLRLHVPAGAAQQLAPRRGERGEVRHRRPGGEADPRLRRQPEQRRAATPPPPPRRPPPPASGRRSRPPAPRPRSASPPPPPPDARRRSPSRGRSAPSCRSARPRHGAPARPPPPPPAAPPPAAARRRPRAPRRSRAPAAASPPPRRAGRRSRQRPPPRRQPRRRRRGPLIRPRSGWRGRAPPAAARSAPSTSRAPRAPAGTAPAR